MVKLALQIKAELENLTDLQPNLDHDFHLRVRCNHCNEENPNVITMNINEEHEIQGSRGTANFVMKCKFCSRQSSASFDTTSKPLVRPYTADHSGQFSPVVVIECRGLEFVGFEPRDGWTAKGVESGTPFEVDLSEGEWVDYDDKANNPVGVSEIEAKFVIA
ncbi:uncharacterized protein VTP21DRAFT_33 [Calcarisporiella thermophila]|uniref:uncharacterized protein n=1 Tax=Calcarisporiella thermophila TaxID=911321 RepID=UPI0037436931